jgi:cyanate permease
VLAAPASIVAPILVGLAADSLGGYQTAFGLLAVTSIVASVLFFLAGRPALPRG